jgi:hypothetical protein
MLAANADLLKGEGARNTFIDATAMFITVLINFPLSSFELIDGRQNSYSRLVVEVYSEKLYFY